MKGISLVREVFSRKTSIDWVLLLSASAIVIFGLITMNAFVGQNMFFQKQLLSFAVALGAFFLATRVDTDVLKRTNVLVWLFSIIIFLLIILFAIGHISRGAQSWFRVGLFAFQPADAMKLILILVLSKYFLLRHVEIAHFRHIIVSGIYTMIPFVLVLLQPAFGSAITIFLIWFGMILVSGVSKKHLAVVFLIGATAFAGLWIGVLRPYQKNRILTFVHPLSDIHGTGYNAYQSTIAVGSGQIIGKGVGYGTQSRLLFLPEYQTDFIFSAFAEEWGFIGVVILFGLFAVLIGRILYISLHGATNFEVLYGAGVAILIISNFFVNIGMTIGLLPVTGVPVPFMSYGGSHILIEFIALGLLVSMKKSARPAHPSALSNEFLGV